MKKTMKKHISLLLAVIMLMTSVVFSAGAACNHQIDPNNPNYYKVVNPTCTEPGYTIYYCTLCGEPQSTGNPVAALSHQYGEEQYEDNGNGAYRKFTACERQYVVDGQVVSCPSKSIETEDGKEVVYYLVKFINNRVTDSYDESITYTRIAKTFKEQELYSCYVREGEEAFFEGKINPYREKTKEYGKYECIGWTEDATLEATAEKNLTEADCADLTSVSKNLVLYPVFVGGIVEYKVVFYDLESNITWPKTVKHGGFPQYSFNGQLYPNPTKPEDIVNYYDFNGWATTFNQTSGIPTENIEQTPIYGDAHFYPAFKSVAKNYTVEFYDQNEKNLIEYDDNGETKPAVFDGMNLKSNLLLENGISVVNNNADALEKESDKTYYYIWKGTWRVLRGDGTYGSTVDLQNFTVNQNDVIEVKDEEGNTVYLDGERNEPKKVIRLVPVYERRLRTYAVDIEMQIPYGEDSDYYRGEADVHVVANNNQLAASGKTDSDGKFRCFLNYQVPFTVTVATRDGKYIGTTTITELTKSTEGDNVEAVINGCRVPMQLNPEYETHCGCIHHISFLQPIFVVILNLLYNFFRVKYVCCYDMYSTIGPLLDYTPD